MKATIKFEDGRTAEIELTPEQVKAVESEKVIRKEKFLVTYDLAGAVAILGQHRHNPLHTFRAKEHAKLLAERFNLEMEMFRWASEMNEGWVPDWRQELQVKFTLEVQNCKISVVDFRTLIGGLFGLAFKTREIAEQAKELFGERILSIYGKQF